ncbi:MAG: V-type ATP synthase subunit E [Nitrososphaerales archaeon]
MSSETFLREIENRKRRELEALDRELAERKEALLRDRNARVQELNERYKRQAHLKSEREATRIVEAARLQAKRIIFQAIDANLDSAFGVIRQDLKNYTKNTQYKRTLEEMINVSKKRLGQDVLVHCRQEDRHLLKGIGVTVSNNPIQTLGGIIVENKQRTLELNFTFEELLRTHEEELRANLLGKG